MKIESIKKDNIVETNNVNRTIWRYFPFKRFQNLIEESSLFFSSPHNFDDDLEGLPKLASLNYKIYKTFENREEIIQRIIEFNKYQ
ncbi:MAG: hypothetical protein SFU25_12175 [Candidatus Caenarcaniphilales bacterium]|nr:hypothetical protein [Candidatus Caenarcaniphilales bacterium]